MRVRILPWCVALCLLLAWAMPGRAQTAEAACLPTGATEAEKLLRETLHQPPQPILATAGTTEAPPPEASLRRVQPRQAARDESARISGSSIRMQVRLEGDDPPAWPAVRLAAVARTLDEVATSPAPQTGGATSPSPRITDPCRYHFTPVFARLHTHQGRLASLEVNFPERYGLAMRESWVLVVALRDEKTEQVFGYAVLPVEIGSSVWAISISAIVLATVYGLLIVVAANTNRRRLDLAAKLEFPGEEPPPRWRWARAARPLFITQDASGIGSLARLQMLVFTLAVAFVYIYVLIRTGALAELSPDVLKLLGITVIGSTLARVAGESGSVSSANRIWLKGKGVLISNDARQPTLSDLVCADGEVEIARVQAIIFSLITVGALLITGPRDLGGFTISAEMLALLGLSQITYVAGKAIPGESVRRLNQEVGALRSAERQVLALATRPPADGAARPEEVAVARAAWDTALAASEDTLLDVYGEMLDLTKLRALRPTFVAPTSVAPASQGG